MLDTDSAGEWRSFTAPCVFWLHRNWTSNHSLGVSVPKAPLHRRHTLARARDGGRNETQMGQGSITRSVLFMSAKGHLRSKSRLVRRYDQGR